MDQLLTLQAGVVSRRQLLAAGRAPHDVRRLLRRRDLTLVHPGVYVDHTGPLTWLQQAWAAVLLLEPAALSHDSAVRAYVDRGDRAQPAGVLHVAVERERGRVSVPGIRVHRLTGLSHRVQWNAAPPRIRLEEALVDLAAQARDDMTAVAVLADAVQARRTTAPRLRATVAARQRVARRAFLLGVLTDIAEGTCSVLEHGYLTRVERAHGLPRGRRQAGGRSVFRDVLYDDFGQVVELDGRMFHDSARQRDADLDRDLEAAVQGLGTVRLGWGQVFGRPCQTAERLAVLLRVRGWTGQLRGCRECG
jgi:hypothetical protein